MIEYPKIETLYNRGDDFRVVPGSFRRPEFGLIDRWVVTEKIDGTNIRIGLIHEPYRGDGWASGDVVSIRGRTDRAQLPSPLLSTLQASFTAEKLAALRKDPDDPYGITLYGEGYGEKIQKGGGSYREGQGFILFDVHVSGRRGSWWLTQAAVEEVADDLGIPAVPVLDSPLFGWPEWSTYAIEKFVEYGFQSRIAREPRHAGGVVVKTARPLYDGHGRRVMWKLKHKDYTGGRR